MFPFDAHHSRALPPRTREGRSSVALNHEIVASVLCNFYAYVHQNLSGPPRLGPFVNNRLSLAHDSHNAHMSRVSYTERLGSLKPPRPLLDSGARRRLRGRTMSHQRRSYTADQLVQKLSMTRSTFLHLKKAGKLPFLEELRPRTGESVRYRAEPIDRYLANGWAVSRQHVRKTSVM
jgi:hypothetical protein